MDFASAARDKTLAIFRELAGDRALQFTAPVPDAQGVIHEALEKDFASGTASDLAFHLTDWNAGAGFLAALLLFPERFTPEEIREGLLDFVTHAPNHIAAAAKLHGAPIQDVFALDVLNQKDP